MLPLLAVIEVPRSPIWRHRSAAVSQDIPVHVLLPARRCFRLSTASVSRVAGPVLGRAWAAHYAHDATWDPRTHLRNGAGQDVRARHLMLTILGVVKARRGGVARAGAGADRFRCLGGCERLHGGYSTGLRTMFIVEQYNMSIIFKTNRFS